MNKGTVPGWSLCGEKLVFLEPGFTKALPGKAGAGILIQEGSVGSLIQEGSVGSLACWLLPLDSHHKGLLSFYHALEPKPGDAKPGSQGNSGPRQLLGWGTAPC